jgi:ribonuclease VapC
VVIDTSALVAIFAREAEAERYSSLIEAAERPCISAASHLEAGMVLGRPARDLLDPFLTDGGIAVIPLDLDQSRIALAAHERYGRGSGWKARLDFGDCLVYALAKSLDRPLLYKGGDLARTDITPAH